MSRYCAATLEVHLGNNTVYFMSRYCVATLEGHLGNNTVYLMSRYCAATPEGHLGNNTVYIMSRYCAATLQGQWYSIRMYHNLGVLSNRHILSAAIHQNCILWQGQLGNHKIRFCVSYVQELCNYYAGVSVFPFHWWTLFISAQF